MIARCWKYFIPRGFASASWSVSTGLTSTSNLGIIRVVGKGSKERIVPIGAVALKALEYYADSSSVKQWQVACRGATPVFLNHRGERITTRSVARIVEKHLRLAGIPDKNGPAWLAP